MAVRSTRGGRARLILWVTSTLADPEAVKSLIAGRLKV